jgi:hypothetical protein
MRDWGFAPSAEELEAVATAARLYRDHCASLRLPTRAAFDGSIDDVLTLDYLAYEGLEPRGAGIETAALVCGDVLRRAASLEWLVSYRGDWFVASREGSPHEIAICPLARLHELECGGRRGGASGMHLWFIQQAAVACIPVLDGETERNVRELLGDGGCYRGFVEKALAQLRTSSGSGRPTQGRP